MVEYNYNGLIEYIKTTTDKTCKVSVRNFIKVIRELVKLGAYKDFKELSNVRVSSSQRHRPDLEPEVAEKNTLETLALMTVAADHGDGIKVATNPLSYFYEGNLGSAMTYFKNYLQDRNLSMFVFEMLSSYIN